MRSKQAVAYSRYYFVGFVTNEYGLKVKELLMYSFIVTS